MTENNVPIVNFEKWTCKDCDKVCRWKIRLFGCSQVVWAGRQKVCSCVTVVRATKIQEYFFSRLFLWFMSTRTHHLLQIVYDLSHYFNREEFIRWLSVVYTECVWSISMPFHWALATSIATGHPFTVNITISRPIQYSQLRTETWPL